MEFGLGGHRLQTLEVITFGRCPPPPPPPIHAVDVNTKKMKPAMHKVQAHTNKLPCVAASGKPVIVSTTGTVINSPGALIYSIRY